jgi:pectate lyase
MKKKARLYPLFKNGVVLAFFLSIVSSCKTPQLTSSIQEEDKLPLAFPGAEGFGKYTVGGRGGRVIVVKNLNDNGAGSFREAAEKKYKRIIVFAVSGTIHLEKRLVIQGNITIAGQSAPGDGICIADHTVSIGGDNIIVRFMRFRLGDKNQKGGMVDGSGGDDAFGGTKRKNIIIDHCSFSWSADEAISIYAGDSTTLQWNMIAEPLNYSYHFESGDSDYENHGYGGIWGGLHSSFHHNLFAHCKSRTPRFNGVRHTKTEFADFRNNVIYNWGVNNVYAGEGGAYNIVNNYYKPGPSTSKNVIAQIANPWKGKDISFGSWHVNGNYVYGLSLVTNNNRLGIKFNEGTTEAEINNTINSMELPSIPIKYTSAEIAFEDVLKKSGCIYPQRDTLDQRIIQNVIDGTGKLIDVQGGYPHGISYELTQNAWPALKQLPTPLDSDQDGMSDEWEISKGLNPNDATDSSQYKLDNNYTNIEIYLNQLVK